MDSISVPGISVTVALTIDAFAEASQLFKKWRKRKAGKRAVGQEELDTSLYKGEKSIYERLNILVGEYGPRFENGDTQSRMRLFKIRTYFRKACIDVLLNSMARENGINVTVDPMALWFVSETTRKDTLLAMDDLTQRLQTPQTFGRPHPDDALPSFPLPPRRVVSTPGPSTMPYPENTTPQRADQRAPMYYQGTPNPSQASFASSQHSAPLPELNSPIYDSGIDTNSSQSSIQRMPSRLSRIFSSTPRPYYQLSPLLPMPAVVPSYKYTEDSEDILEEGIKEVDRLWAAANSVRDRLQAERPHSAPLLQPPWNLFAEDEFYSSSSLPMPDVTSASSKY